MSLCILLRTSDGGALMAADSAVSTVYEGVPYRVTNEQDHEKVITHLGHMIFCSGHLDRCKALRAYIRSMDKIDYGKISSYAKSLWGGDTTDNSTGLLICQPDNKLVGMLSAQNFKVTELPWNLNGLDIQTLGFRMKEAYQAACTATAKSEDWRGIVLGAYSAAICEEVGGVLHVFSRLSSTDAIKTMTIPLPEPNSIRCGVFVPIHQSIPLHAVVQAADFLDKSGRSMFTKEGKIAGEYLDLRGVNIVDGNGNTIITIDESGIRWSASYSPIKYQYSSVGVTGPWHNNMAADDKYRRESFDGGTTWSPGYQFKGEDGKPGQDGSDARVPSYITSTGITSTKIWSPEIIANEFSVTPGSTSQRSGGFVLYGANGSSIFEAFRIAYNGTGGGAPTVTINPGSCGHVYWEGPAMLDISADTNFYGYVDFSGAKSVKGVYATFA